MRGLLEEDFVKTELDTEVAELLRQFDDWKPATKVLKDVKYRLEAVRSKLWEQVKITPFVLLDVDAAMPAI